MQPILRKYRNRSDIQGRSIRCSIVQAPQDSVCVTYGFPGKFSKVHPRRGNMQRPPGAVKKRYPYFFFQLTDVLGKRRLGYKQTGRYFASSDYCPITNLEHADMAYEWMFNGVNSYYMAMWQLQDLANRGMNVPGGQAGKPALPPKAPDANAANNPTASKQEVQMTKEEIAISKVLKDAFPAYVNSLQLKDEQGHLLTLDKDGNGSFRDYIKGKYMQSAQDALSRGLDVSSASWVKVKNGQVIDVDLNAYPAAATRMKAAPAFDKLNLSSAENDEFGTENNTPKHFSAISKQYESKTGEMADSETIKLMNPMNFIGNGKAVTAKHFRIRHGAIDRDTALAIPAILALKLQNSGVDVNFYSPWNRGHAGDYDLPELFNWIDSICKA